MAISRGAVPQAHACIVDGSISIEREEKLYEIYGQIYCQPEGTGLAMYQTILEEQVLPSMQEIGFSSAYIKQGPLSRQFKTVAVIGVK